MPMRQVYPAEDVDDKSLVDIVAVHGLNPRSKDDEEHAWDTWRKPAGKNGRLWLKDDLPKGYTAKARIFIWVYNSTLVYGRDRGQFIDKANDLLEALRIERRGDPDRPLIFLAHSLGGILVQQALVNAHNNEYYKSIRTWTTGLAFFGTPHDGGNKSLVALGTVAARVASLLHSQTPNDVIETLKTGSLFADLLGEQWRHQLESYQLISFWEGKSNTVPKKSAIFGLPGTRENIVELNADHSNLCRYDRSIQDQDNFKLVANNIQDLYEDALNRTHASPSNSARNQKGQEQFELVLSLAAAPEIDYFVGRAGNLSSIEKVLLPITAPERKVVVLHGLGGIGKSQLAIEYARQHRDDYSAVFWLNAKTEDTLKQSFVAGARRLPEQYIDQKLLSGSQNEQALGVILHEMKAWFNLPGNHRWLLIFDNVDNPKISNNKDQDSYDVRSYFPETHQGSILVTTRWSTLRIGHLLEVAKLPTAAESVSLLEKLSDRAIGDESGIGDLLERLDGLPLALATAGSFLGLTGETVSEYLHDYEVSWLELHESSPELLSYDKSIYSTWDLSYNHIRREDESAAKLLEFWAYFDNQDLWYDLLKAGDGEGAPDWFQHIVGTKHAFRAAVAKLQNHALVERLKDSRGYSMHHCVHAWVKNVLFKNIEDQSMRLAIACVDKTIPKEPARDGWVTKQRLLPHSARCLKLTRDWDKEGRAENENCIARFFGRVGWLHLNQGRLMEAETTTLRAQKLFEKIYGSFHMFTIDTESTLAKVYDVQGRLNEAESMYMQNLTRYEDIRGPDGESTLCTVLELGWLYKKQGKLKDAESMTQRALIGFERTLGPNHDFTSSALNVLATIYAQQNRLEEAESMYLRALLGQERVFGSDHPTTLLPVLDLAHMYHDQGKLKAAQSMYQWALTGYETTRGPDHLATLYIVVALGNIYALQDKLKEAESMYLRALLGYTRNPHPNPSAQLDLYYNTGLLYQVTQKFEKAREFFSQAYQGSQELLGSQHDHTIDALIQVNIEMMRNEQPTAFISGVISMPVSERTTEAELWANIEKSVVETTRSLSAVKISRASHNDTESEEESEEQTIESQVARICAEIRAGMAEKARKRQARANQPCE